MSSLLILVLFCVTGYLLLKWTETRERVANTEARLNSLELQLERLRRAGAIRPAETPAPPQPEAAVATPPPVPVTQPLSPQPPPIPATPAPQPVMAATVQSAARPMIEHEEPLRTVNWEKFLGVKIFAWLGGLALFLGVAFFVKYSFENNLITAPMRIGLGYLTGLGLIAGGLCLSRERSAVTVQTLCATGTLILYATTFAAHARYHFFGTAVSFTLMSIVTVAAFTLAVRLNAQVVAVLGLLGGFLTPPLLSTGVDRPMALFGYLALLDCGLIAIALTQRWNHLTFLAAIATVLMQAGWVMRFFEPLKLHTAMTIFFGFAALFSGGFATVHRQAGREKFITAAALLLAGSALAFGFHLLGYREIGTQPATLFGYVFLVDAIILFMIWLTPSLRLAHGVAGGAVFLLLGIWTLRYLNAGLLNLTLGLYAVFAVLHSVVPVVLARKEWTLPDGRGSVAGEGRRIGFGQVFPVMALALMLLPLLKLPEVSWALWPVVLLMDLLGVGLAILAASLLPLLAVVLLTSLLAAAWIFKVPTATADVTGLMVIVGGFGLFFMAAAAFAARKLGFKAEAEDGKRGTFGAITAVSSVMPFCLLVLAVLRLPLTNPSGIFALAGVLVIAMMALVRWLRIDALSGTGLFATLLLEYVWHLHRWSNAQQGISLAWYVAFGLLFLGFPFVFRERLRHRAVPWVVAGLSLPAHFVIIYNGFLNLHPGFEPKGLIPAVLALPCLLALGGIARGAVADTRDSAGASPHLGTARNTQLAMFGGASLFFITLVFPIQFERQWLTMGWALEGAALLWLFHRVPHPGLRVVGFGLLVTSFVRLALNPWVITEYSRTGTPIVNWYLYTYGLVAICLLVGARLLAPPRNRIQELNAPPVLYGLGAILSFLLVNIEIADSFSGAGAQLTFNFSGALAQDMAYSLAWALFAFALLGIGFKLKNSPTRYAGMGLLVLTLCKLFLHDLWRLGGLYRIGSLVGLAIVLILVSFIYQRFLSVGAIKKSG